MVVSGAVTGISAGADTLIADSLIEGNTTGVSNTNGAVVAISNTYITANGTGVNVSTFSGSIGSFQNNFIFGNTTEVSGSLSPLSKS